MRKLVPMLVVLALATVGLAACGDDEDTTSAETTEETTAATEETSEGGGEGGSIAISANPEGALEYEQTSVSAPAGEVTIDFDNPASLPHDVVVEDDGGSELIRTEVIDGGTTSASGELEAGEYTFYCSVDGHREAGMEGTLTVE